MGVEQNRPISTPGVANFGDALHGCDHRLRQPHDGLHHGAADRHHMREVSAAAISVGAARAEFFQVMSGREDRAVGGDHYGAHGLVAGDVIESSVQFADQSFGETVAGGRTIQRQHADTADRFTQKNGWPRCFRACWLNHDLRFHRWAGASPYCNRTAQARAG
jgi:hypothetical protein